jgi:hypothetical protein
MQQRQECRGGAKTYLADAMEISLVSISAAMDWENT